MSPTNSQSNNETNRQAPLVSSLPFDYTSSKKITMADPKLLLDHPANVGLFGLQRLIEIADLVVSIQRGFDQSHPIKVKKLGNGALEMIDGHRRQRAALELDLPLVPIELASFDSDEEERREMIEANLVRNHKFRSVGQCTAVRLIEQLQPRDVKRGRPPKKNQVETTEITEVNGEPSEDSNADGDRERRKFYADLLGMKIHRFRIVDYINRHGTPEEQNEVDLKLRTPAAVYKVVHARVNNIDLKPVDDPREFARRAAFAARNISRLLTAAQETHAPTPEKIEEGLELLRDVAKKEVGGKEPRGTTAAQSIAMLRWIISKRHG